jgi:hypothetical protein
MRQFSWLKSLDLFSPRILGQELNAIGTQGELDVIGALDVK